MSRRALVALSTGRVVNVIEAEDSFAVAHHAIIEIGSRAISIGDRWDGADFIAGPPPPPSPEEASEQDWQDFVAFAERLPGTNPLRAPLLALIQVLRTRNGWN